jgi:hypothetical protein
MKRLAVVLIALALVGCGGSYDEEARQAYLDKCIVELGPQHTRFVALDYCLAKWRQSQREK